MQIIRVKFVSNVGFWVILSTILSSVFQRSIFIFKSNECASPTHSIFYVNSLMLFTWNYTVRTILKWHLGQIIFKILSATVTHTEQSCSSEIRSIISFHRAELLILTLSMLIKRELPGVWSSYIWQGSVVWWSIWKFYLKSWERPDCTTGRDAGDITWCWVGLTRGWSGWGKALLGETVSLMRVVGLFSCWDWHDETCRSSNNFSLKKCPILVN